jgi:hypothetical protein
MRAETKRLLVDAAVIVGLVVFFFFLSYWFGWRAW